MVPLAKSVVLILASFITGTVCRQMCLSCQYVDNPKQEGIECASAPRNWTFGHTRMRCNFRCNIQAQFDLETGDPTYFFRGCTSSHEEGNEGCEVGEEKEFCTFTCVDEDYCNERTFRMAPSVEESASAAVRPGFLVRRGRLELLTIFVFALNVCVGAQIALF